MSDTFKMVIPKEVEQKIRYLQNKFPHTEWSGVLFITHSGSFENKDLVITCVDIYPMDLGNSTYTEFKNTPDVVAYIAEHCDTLWDCDMALVHSHHSMNCFFSGTDLATLRSEGNDTNNFVSLIVNNEGTYTAAITRKITYTEDVFEQCSASFFDKEPVRYENRMKTTDKSRIEYFMLDIEKEEVHNPFSYIDERFNEIEENKRKTASPVLSSPVPIISSARHCQSKEEPFLFSQKEMGTQLSLDPTEVHNAVAKLLLCSLIINPEKIDLDKWISKNMVSVYNHTFGSPDSMLFQEYSSWAVDYTLDHFEEASSSSLPPDTDDTLYLSSLSNAIIEELLSYSTSDNPYIDAYINLFDAFVMTEPLEDSTDL